MFLAGRADHDHLGAELSHGKLIHGREDLLLDLLRDAMFDGHVQMTIVPELAPLFLKREQDPVERFLKVNNCHGAVQTFLKYHTIEGAQAGQELLQEFAEGIVDE